MHALCHIVPFTEDEAEPKKQELDGKLKCLLYTKMIILLV